MNQRFIDELFSNLSNNEYLRVGWTDPAEKFHYDSFTNVEKFQDYVDNLKKNPDAISIYFSPNPSFVPTTRHDPHLIKIDWLFIDIDQISRPELDSRLNDFEVKYKLKPTFIVYSGKGFHLYWRLIDKWTPDEWNQIQGAIRKYFGADDVVSNVVNLLRIPGTENRKCYTSIGKNPHASVNSYQLQQNYPNPYNPSTNIEFTLPKTEFTTLKVYNILGKEVSTLVSKKLNSGNHTYTFNGKNLASGVYYYQLVAGDFREVKKMIMLRWIW